MGFLIFLCSFIFLILIPCLISHIGIKRQIKGKSSLGKRSVFWISALLFFLGIATSTILFGDAKIKLFSIPIDYVNSFVFYLYPFPVFAFGAYWIMRRGNDELRVYGEALVHFRKFRKIMNEQNLSHQELKEQWLSLPSAHTLCPEKKPSESNSNENQDSEHTSFLDSVFAFGTGGLMLLVSSFLTLFPLYMARVPFWLWLIIVVCIRSLPMLGFLIDSVIWIVGLVFSVQGEQTSVSVLFYIAFAFWFFVYGLNYIRIFVSLIPRKECTNTNKKFHHPVNRRKVIRTVIISILSVCIVLGSFYAIFFFSSVGSMQGDWYAHTEKPLVKIRGTHITYDGLIYDGTIAANDEIVFHDSSYTLDFALRGDSLVLEKKYKTGAIEVTRFFHRKNADYDISDMCGTWICGNNTITINDGAATIYVHGNGNVPTTWYCMRIGNNSICKMSITTQFIHYIFTYQENDTIVRYTYNNKGELLYEQTFNRVIE